MQQTIKTAQKISSECWNAFKTFMQSERTDADWDRYVEAGKQLDQYENAEKELFRNIYLTFVDYAEATTKETKQ